MVSAMTRGVGGLPVQVRSKVVSSMLFLYEHDQLLDVIDGIGTTCAVVWRVVQRALRTVSSGGGSVLEPAA